MKHVNNNKGVAMMMVMILSVVVLAVMSMVLYMITAGTQFSGAQKRYVQALEAGVGGEDVFVGYVTSAITLTSDIINNLSLQIPDQACLTKKKDKETDDWGGCSKSVAINIADPTTYDMRYDVGNYRIYAKIVDTILGNSGDIGTGEFDLETTGTSDEGTKGVKTHRYFVYTMEVDVYNRSAATVANAKERAKFTMLYRY